MAALFSFRREYGIKGVHGARALVVPFRGPALCERLAPPVRRRTWIRQDVVRRWMPDEVAPADAGGEPRPLPSERQENCMVHIEIDVATIQVRVQDGEGRGAGDVRAAAGVATDGAEGHRRRP